jgi:hypothetical protein
VEGKTEEEEANLRNDKIKKRRHNKKEWVKKVRKNSRTCITNSMELCASREAKNCSATQEIPSILWSLKFHYRVQPSDLIF